MSRHGRQRSRLASACLLMLVAAAACGKKGPPLAPLVIVPAAVSGASAGRFGDRVLLRFTPPDKNTDNSAPADVSRVEVYAMSVPDAADAPDAAEIVRDGTRVTTVELAAKAGNGESEPPSGPRLVTEALTPESAQVVERSPKGSRGSKAPGPAGAAGGSAGAAASSLTDVLAAFPGLEPVMKPPPVPVRVYALVPVSSRGRRGPSTVAMVPLAPAPGPPAAPAIAYTETATTMTWLIVEGVDGYNVYETGSGGSTTRAAPGAAAATSDVPGTPLNEAPLAAPTFEHKRVEFGKPRCYRVTSVETVATRRVESVLSEEACVTPVDTFPPAVPTGVAAVADAGSIGLIWDAVSAGDLAGYIVLRGEVPGDTLQALTPEPIKETTFRDTTVTAGVRYVYAVVAVDALKNASAQSSRVEETAR